MYEVLFTFLLLTQTFVLTEIPSIPKCHITDSLCLKQSAQVAAPVLAAGMPEVGTEPLDIMHVDRIKVDLAGLKLDIKNMNIKGLKKAIVKDVSVDTAKKQLRLSWDTDISMKGQYKASGKLLILPINGDGDVNVKLKRLNVDMTMPFDIVKDDNGKQMIKLLDHQAKFQVMDNAHFQLTNLFNGNQVLAQALLTFMNENWKILIKEFGDPLLTNPNDKVYNAIKAYLQSQPLDNIIEY